jgi:hypothetical protein
MGRADGFGSRKLSAPVRKLQRGVNKSGNSQAAEELVLCWAAILPSQGGCHPCRPVSDRAQRPRAEAVPFQRHLAKRERGTVS